MCQFILNQVGQMQAAAPVEHEGASLLQNQHRPYQFNPDDEGEELHAKVQVLLRSAIVAEDPYNVPLAFKEKRALRTWLEIAAVKESLGQDFVTQFMALIETQPSGRLVPAR